MAISDLSICNSALIKIGQETITALSDNNHRAKILSEQYSKLRDEVLVAHPWNFAIKRAELAELSEAPEFEFSKKFQLPNDCLRILTLEYPDMIWRQEGDCIVTDEPTVKIKYIQRVTDTSKFSAHFAEMLSLKIASEISYMLTNDKALMESMERKYQNFAKDARSFNAQSGGTPPNLMIDSFVKARF